jgi:hypothetical protein
VEGPLRRRAPFFQRTALQPASASLFARWGVVSTSLHANEVSDARYGLLAVVGMFYTPYFSLSLILSFPIPPFTLHLIPYPPLSLFHPPPSLFPDRF